MELPCPRGLSERRVISQWPVAPGVDGCKRKGKKIQVRNSPSRLAQQREPLRRLNLISLLFDVKSGNYSLF